MKPQIHQIIPVLDERDAIGNYAVEIQKLLVAWGHESKIFVWRKQSSQGDGCCHYSQYRQYSGPDNILICHYAISSPVFDYFLHCPDRKMMIYHNITPAHFFRGINDETYFLTKEGRVVLKQAVGKIDLALGVSPFNQRELEEIGFSNPGVLPLLIDFEQFDGAGDEATIEKYSDGKKNLLFVGRILPNKKQEDLIRLFYYYKRYFNPDSRLILVGTASHAPGYHAILEKLVDQLGVEDVVFAGSVPQAELKAYFKLADFFVCMSEHEGFCVPLIEAMYQELPVMAFASSAVPETLGDGGVLIDAKDFLRSAALLNELMNDHEAQAALIEKQKRRLDDFSREKIERKLKQYIDQLIGT
jgi:L-malate glycosyltransferase